ncbi:MAG: Gfo/Idh/MocA family oxidoreductase [Planctomycetes bacterium]|nr:Gfo/Idh/MocA family oxidoreductase [Planctomycetota bacterium]
MRTPSRRQFLKRAAGTLAAAVAAPYVVPASARGADGTVSPSERITMGAIGIGGRGGYVMGALMQNQDVQMVTVCDVRGDRRQAAKDKVDKHYGSADCKPLIDFRELLGRSDIDAVMIATGENWHATASIYAARAGKDIYSEKPPTHTIAEGRALADTIARCGTIYQCGTQRRSIARFRFACDLAKSGALGELKTLRAEGAGKITEPAYFSPPPQPLPPAQEVEWDLWLGPAAWRPYSPEYLKRWKQHRDFQGGSISEWGSHTVDLAQMAMGADNTSPARYEYIGDAGDRIRCTYANGVDLILIDGSWPLHVEFTGTEGSVYVDDDGNIRTQPESLLRGRNFGKGYPAEGHVRAFLDCVKTRRQPISNAEATQRSMTACHIANMVLYLGRPLTWDPVKEEFPGDAEANRMRHRAIRAPWRL